MSTTTTTNAPVDLDALLKEGAKLKDRIDLVGVELEGGWKTLPSGITLVHDGSVNVELYEDDDTPAPPPLNPDVEQLYRNTFAGNFGMTSARRIARTLGMTDAQFAHDYEAWAHNRLRNGRIQRRSSQVGELPSPPLQTRDVSTWMKKYYPSKVNGTCGLHVHQSFKKAIHYQRLMNPSYMWTIIHYVAQWAKAEGLPKSHPIWARLEGKSEYCQHVFHADIQVHRSNKDFDRHAQGHRYTVIAFHYNRLGTVECRLLPMMETADQGVRAVQNILNVTNAFLLKHNKKEEKLVGEVKIERDEWHDIQREIV